LITDHSQQLTTRRWEQAGARAHERVNHLTREDKLAIALHDFAAVSATDIVPFDYCDGPNGVRGHQGATAFPSALAVAASFDRDLAGRYGAALGREVLTAGKNAILAPAMDIARVPRGGRAGENLGEDPILAGEIGGAIGAGIQSEGVLAVAKHYVANNFEWLRTGEGSATRRSDAIDVRISSRTLHEIYLEPFRRALVRYGVAGLLGSYNRLNGRYVCQHPELLDLPRTQWGWAGFTVPDFLFAVRDPRAALEAGLDLPALGSDSELRPEDLLENEVRLDSIALHVLTAVEYVGVKPMQNPSPQPPPESAAVARTVAIDGMVLLKNDGPLLPLPETARVAVVDAGSVRALLVVGGAASVSLSDERIESVPEALGTLLASPDQVRVAPAGDGEVPLPVVSSDAAAGPIEAAIRDDVTGTEVRRTLGRFELRAPDGMGPDWSATVTTTLRAERAGTHHLTLTFGGRAAVYVDDEPVASGFREASPFVTGPDYPLHAVVDLAAGQAVTVRVEYITSVAISIPGTPAQPRLELGWRQPDDRIAQAAALAAECDVALVLAGRLTGESMDADGLTLPGTQEAFIAAVAAANPRTVVVTLGAGPVVMPWLPDVSAVIHTWFPGEQFAPALADVLIGRAEPGGRLPITFPTHESVTPVQDPGQYPGVKGVATYSEELLVGYRWYQDLSIKPAFPFGHGLGYTSFEFDDLRTEVTMAGIGLTFGVRNVGPRPGKAVPQVYVTFPPDAGEPPVQLKAFDAVRLEPGEVRDLSIDIPFDDLAIFDDESQSRVVPAGRYEIQIGVSPLDHRLRAAVQIGPHQD
jgi:beta-glucosidase